MKGGEPPLSGAEIINVLKALSAGDRLPHIWLDDIGPNDHHARLHDHSNVLDGSPIAVAGLPALAARQTGGTYNGDSTFNRAIAHGLGVIPKLIVIIDASGMYLHHLFPGIAAIPCVYLTGTAAGSSYAVTAPDINNFYVGNSTSYAKSANNTGIVYTWVALG